MSIIVKNQFDETRAKEELKKSHKIVIEYVKLLKNSIEEERKLTQLAISKLRKSNGLGTNDLLYLTDKAKQYRLIAHESITRNKHMNNNTQITCSQNEIDALLCDFINFIASHGCIDFGLYTLDLNQRK